MKINLKSNVMLRKCFFFLLVLLFALLVVAFGYLLIPTAFAKMPNQQGVMPPQFVGDWSHTGEGPFCTISIRADGSIVDLEGVGWGGNCNTKNFHGHVLCPINEADYTCVVSFGGNSIQLNSRETYQPPNAGYGTFDANITMLNKDTLRAFLNTDQLLIMPGFTPIRSKQQKTVDFRRLALRACPPGFGPGGIKAGSPLAPQAMTQEQRQWLYQAFGHDGIAPVGYGGEPCEASNPTQVSTNTPESQQLRNTPTPTPGQVVIALPTPKSSSEPAFLVSDSYPIPVLGKWRNEQLPINVRLDDTIPEIWNQTIYEAVQKWNTAIGRPVLQYRGHTPSVNYSTNVLIRYDDCDFVSVFQGKCDGTSPGNTVRSVDAAGFFDTAQTMNLHNTFLPLTPSPFCIPLLACYGLNLMTTVLHELGHSLGLNHSNIISDLMAEEGGGQLNPTKADVETIRKLYGLGK